MELQKHEARAARNLAPILYVTRLRQLDEAIAMNNAVGAGLSSSIFTLNMREAEQFMSALWLGLRHCQREHWPQRRRNWRRVWWREETGGGREASSDSWKAYMRRATNTVNYSTALPLAQGVKFDV